MPVEELQRTSVRKIWGRRDVPPAFGAVGPGEEPLGEVWFEGAGSADEALLVKYLFTSERLSIQVHPGDEAARRIGCRSGKDEAWIVLAADPGAEIGIGLQREVGKAELRAAALSGEIESLIDWRPVSAGDIFYSPAGTVHALGPGLKVIEVQQNVDLTYRLYDYGRPRELHLDAAVQVASPTPYTLPTGAIPRERGRTTLVQATSFTLECLSGATARVGDVSGRPVWLIPTEDGVSADGRPLDPGRVYLTREEIDVEAAVNAHLFFAYSAAAAPAAAPSQPIVSGA